MDGWPSVESRSCCGRASTSLNDGISDHVWTSVRQNCYVIIQELVDGVALVQYTPFCLRIRCILLSVSMKFVRKLLTIEQNQLLSKINSVWKSRSAYWTAYISTLISRTPFSLVMSHVFVGTIWNSRYNYHN